MLRTLLPSHRANLMQYAYRSGNSAVRRHNGGHADRCRILLSHCFFCLGTIRSVQIFLGLTQGIK